MTKAVKYDKITISMMESYVNSYFSERHGLQNMKKILALLVALTLCVSLVALFASCSGRTTEEATKFVFTDITDKNGEVIGCSVAPGKLFVDDDAKEIPAVSPEGTPVTAIKRMAFLGRTTITEVVLPDSVTTIENLAFSGCASLTKVSANGVTVIGNYAFDACEKLSDFQLPAGLVTIGIYAFRNCVALQSVTLPDSLESFDAAFYRCTGLTSVTIGEILNIGEGSFYGCTGIQSITLPETLVEIKAFAFQNCSKLKAIVIPENVSVIEKGAFKGCSALTSATFQSNKVIALEQTFSGCSALTNVVLPDSLETIGESTFDYCTNLLSVTLSSALKFLGQRAFGGCTSFETLNYEGSWEQWGVVKKPDTSGNDKTETNKISKWYEGAGNFEIDVIEEGGVHVKHQVKDSK